MRLYKNVTKDERSSWKKKRCMEEVLLQVGKVSYALNNNFVGPSYVRQHFRWCRTFIKLKFPCPLLCQLEATAKSSAFSTTGGSEDLSSSHFGSPTESGTVTIVEGGDEERDDEILLSVLDAAR